MRKFKIMVAVLAGTAAFSAQAANAAEGDIAFYDSDDCVSKYGPANMNSGYGSPHFDSEAHTRVNCKYSEACKYVNDEIKSVWIAATVRPGTRIKVWDSPDGSFKDDWAEIVVKAVKPNGAGSTYGRNGVCIGSFQSIYSGADYQLYYHRVNGPRRQNFAHRHKPSASPFETSTQNL